MRPLPDVVSFSSSRLVDGRHGDPMPLVEQRRSVGIAEVELIVEVHAIEHDAFGEGVRSLQAKVHATCGAATARTTSCNNFARG